MKKIRKFIIITIAIFFIAMTFSYVQAKENSIEQQIENYAKDIDISNISTEDILKAYDELSEKYSNEEIANMIEEHKEEIKDKGVSEEVISAGTNFLKTTLLRKAVISLKPCSKLALLSLDKLISLNSVLRTLPMTSSSVLRVTLGTASILPAVLQAVQLLRLLMAGFR